MRAFRPAETRAIQGPRPRTVAEDVSHLMRRITVTDTGCWEIDGWRSEDGYGRISCQGIDRMLAHRAAWTLRYGDPGELCVLHSCDNPPCVRPSHLFLGTRVDNNADRDTKGRSNTVGRPGEQHPLARLTEADVRAIRSADREVGRDELARRYGVSRATINSIIQRVTWKCVA